MLTSQKYTNQVRSSDTALSSEIVHEVLKEVFPEDHWQGYPTDLGMLEQGLSKFGVTNRERLEKMLRKHRQQILEDSENLNYVGELSRLALLDRAMEHEFGIDYGYHFKYKS